MYDASAPYYGDDTDHLVHNAYTVHTAAHLQRLVHNHEPKVQEVFTVTLREAHHHRNTCPQYRIHQQGLPTTLGICVWNHLQLLLPCRRHIIQMNHRCRKTGPLAILYTDVGGGPTGDATILEEVGTKLHQVRVTPSSMPVLQRAGTHHVFFLQHPDWPNKSLLENHLRKAATTAGRPQPTE